MHPWLTYCILIFFCSTTWGVKYVLYIINTFIAHFTLIGYRSLPCLSAPFFRELCPYIINTVFGKISRYSTFFNAHARLFINCPLRANQSVYICYKYLLKWLNKAILSTFLTIKTTASLNFSKCLK